MHLQVLWQNNTGGSDEGKERSSLNPGELWGAGLGRGWVYFPTPFLPRPLGGWWTSRREGEAGLHVGDLGVPAVGQDAPLFESRAKFRLHRDPRMLRSANGSNDVQITLPHPYEVLNLLVHLHHPGQDSGV